MKDSNNTTGNRNRDLSAGRAVPQTTAPLRAPVQTQENIPVLITKPSNLFGTGV
jgi:hypothetical protein